MSGRPERQPHAVLARESRLRKARKIEALLAARRPLAGARVLDVGAGAGVIAAHLASVVGEGGKVFAVDVLDQRVEREGYEFRTVADTALPFDDAAFDVVLSNHIIEHVGGRTDQRRHPEVGRVLRPGGVCYLAVPNRWVLVEPHFRLPFLSWVPGPLRTPYVRLARRGPAYDCLLPSRRTLLGLLRGSGLRYEEATIDAMRLFAEIEGVAGPAARVLTASERLLRPLLPVVPTMIFLLHKDEPAGA